MLISTLLEQKKSLGNDEALGRSPGGLSTKVHIAGDRSGKPVKLLLTGGKVHDSTQATELISEHPSENVIADKAYDSDEIIEAVLEGGAKPVIPSKSNRLVQRKYNRRLYKQRNRIERLINRVKHFRRAATRYDKTARNFLAFWYVASIFVWIH